jgi:DNA-binding beta-propeller fold protein YncE
VSCYDDRVVYIFEAETRQAVAFIRDLVGPFELEVDPARERAYVADFESSTVRVVDLRGLSDPYLPKPRIVLTLGTPRTERGAL